MLDELQDYSSTYLLSVIHNQDPWLDGYYKPAYRKDILRNDDLVSIGIISNEQLYEFFKTDK